MKELKNKILDNLYEIREEELEKQYIKKYGKVKEKENTQSAENEVIEFIKIFIKDEKDIQKLYKKLNKFELSIMSEGCFWHKPYYKTGFIDGMNLEREIKEENFISGNLNDSILYENFDEIIGYFEDKKCINLKTNKDYIDTTKEIEEIKTKYPNVRDFLENNKVFQSTAEEMEAILDIIRLYDNISMYEADEMFKIGLREGKSL